MYLCISNKTFLLGLSAGCIRNSEIQMATIQSSAFEAIQSESMSFSGSAGKLDSDVINTWRRLVNFIPFFRTLLPFASGNSFRRGPAFHNGNTTTSRPSGRINQLPTRARPPSQAWKCHHIPHHLHLHHLHHLHHFLLLLLLLLLLLNFFFFFFRIQCQWIFDILPLGLLHWAGNDPAILRSCDPPTRYAQTWLAVAINRLAPSCIIVSNFAVEGAATAETPTDSDWIRSNAIKPKWVIVSITRFQHGICCTNHFFDFIAFCLLLFTSQQPQQKPKKQKQKQKQKHEGMIVVFTLLATRWWIGSQDNKKKTKKKETKANETHHSKETDWNSNWNSAGNSPVGLHHSFIKMIDFETCCLNVTSSIYFHRLSSGGISNRSHVCNWWPSRQFGRHQRTRSTISDDFETDSPIWLDWFHPFRSHKPTIISLIWYQYSIAFNRHQSGRIEWN